MHLFYSENDYRNKRLPKQKAGIQAACRGVLASGGVYSRGGSARGPCVPRMNADN